MKTRRFKIDEWVSYCQFPDSNFGDLKNERKSAVILEVLDKRASCDYCIFIEGGKAVFDGITITS